MLERSKQVSNFSAELNKIPLFLNLYPKSWIELRYMVR